MMLAFIECKNGPHEPTAGTAEETEADLPATETGSGRIRAYPAVPSDQRSDAVAACLVVSRGTGKLARQTSSAGSVVIPRTCLFAPCW